MIDFTQDGWNEYKAWQTEDKKTLKKINKLIDGTVRSPFEGLGHPEPLTGNLAEYWSREIDEKNRLIYKVLDGGKILIAHCNGHYFDK